MLYRLKVNPNVENRLNQNKNSEEKNYTEA